MVLDAPMLDFAATVELRAAGRSLPVVGLPVPGSLVWVARRLAGVRFGLDPEDTDYLDDTQWLTVPVLAFHGTSDDTVPASVTRRLAAAAPSLVTAVMVPGAEHVESWNVAPRRYDALVRRFLTPYAP